MSPGATLVPRDSPAYQEFARLYRLAQVLRPTVADRWNGELYAADGDTWGGFDPSTGRISLSRELVLRHLKGSERDTSPGQQAQALATVLHEVTHAQMKTDAPDEPNAVRSKHSLGLMEGFAEVRALRDFRAFARLAQYAGLDLPKPQYPAAFGAAEDLLKQASGPRKIFTELLAEGTRGPGVMHFDQLADGVLRNRLHDVVPDRTEDRLAVRAALIETMMHPAWPDLKNVKGIGTGQAVARDIRRALDARVDQIRHHYQSNPRTPYPAEAPNPAAIQLSPRDARTPKPEQAPSASGVAMRFLDAQAPAARATSYRPTLGQGARGAGSPTTPKAQRPTERRWD